LRHLDDFYSDPRIQSLMRNANPDKVQLSNAIVRFLERHENQNDYIEYVRKDGGIEWRFRSPPRSIYKYTHNL
jgi:hypothetical protein